MPTQSVGVFKRIFDENVSTQKDCATALLLCFINTEKLYEKPDIFIILRFWEGSIQAYFYLLVEPLSGGIGSNPSAWKLSTQIFKTKAVAQLVRASLSYFITSQVKTNLLLSLRSRGCRFDSCLLS